MILIYWLLAGAICILWYVLECRAEIKKLDMDMLWSNAKYEQQQKRLQRLASVGDPRFLYELSSQNIHGMVSEWKIAFTAGIIKEMDKRHDQANSKTGAASAAKQGVQGCNQEVGCKEGSPARSCLRCSRASRCLRGF